MLLLYLRIEHRDATVPVELPLDATVADLKTAAQDAGGPPAAQQVLTVGAEQLSCSGDTPLSDTLVSSEAVVGVWRRRRQHRKTVSVGTYHCVALLEDGGVVGWGNPKSFQPIPEFDGRVSSVHAGRDVSAAVVAGRLIVWGAHSAKYTDHLRRLEGTEVVCCSASAFRDVIAVVDGGGHVHVLGADCELTGISAAVSVSCGLQHVAVLTRDGTVAVRGCGTSQTHALDLGGRTAVSVDAGRIRTMVLLDDGTARCFTERQQHWVAAAELQPPPDLADVVSCCAPPTPLVCCEDGRVVGWGRSEVRLEGGSSAFVAVEGGAYCVAAITADGDVVMGVQKTLPLLGRAYPSMMGVLRPNLCGRKVALP